MFSNFYCKRNPDIEKFIRNVAVRYEKAGISKTVLFCEQSEDIINIIAYYSVSIKSFQIPVHNIDKQKLKKLKNGLNKEEWFPSVLIGQLGKNDLFGNQITGKELLTHCINHILDGVDKLGGRFLLLDCKEDPKLISFYESYGFSNIGFNTKNNLISMIGLISNYKKS